MPDIPPPPPGFTLDRPAIPPPPPGFTLDAPARPPEGVAPAVGGKTAAEPSASPAASAGDFWARALGKTAGIGSALWKGALHGAGDVVYGGAQIGARAQEPTAFSEPDPTLAQRIDEATRAREQTYQQNPTVQRHPIAAGLGRVGGNVATAVPLMAIPGGQASLPARLGMAAGVGAAERVMQPTTDPNFGRAKLRQAGEGLVGGAAGGALGEIVSSTLGKAIAGNAPQAVDKLLTRTYRSVVKPSRVGQQSAPQLEAQDHRILTAVDQIIANQPNLTLTDAAGQQVAGQLPRSLRQFSEALDQTKRAIFQQYDQMAAQTGAAGVKVDLAPAIQRLQQIAASPEVIDFHPKIAQDALNLAKNLAARGSYSPSEAQDVIQNLNRTLAGFWKNPTNETVTLSTVLAPVSQILRDGLDAAIRYATGPGYQMLRNRYGALRSVEKDVAGAVQREANKIPGGIGGIFSDLAASEEAIRGVLTLNAAALGRAATIKGAQAAMRYINNPNRAIMRMFQRRTQPPSGPVRQALGGVVSTYAPGAGATVGGFTASRDPRPSVVGP